MEHLERREVFSASFGSAMTIGADELRATLVTDVATDQAGNSYSTGSFAGTFDFDPGVGVAERTARGSGDIFVAKYRPDGSLAWVQQLGGDAVQTGPTDRAQRIALGADGAVYIVGQFLGTAQIGASTFTSAGSHDAFLAKLDSSGVVQWARQWGSASQEVGWSVDVDAANNVYALSTDSTLSVLKFSPSGTNVWTKTIANRPSFAAMESNLTVDAAGNVFIAGHFWGSVDFDPGPKQKLASAGPNAAGFVLKLDTGGAFKWVSPFAGRTVGGVDGYSHANQITLDGAGNVVVGGWYRGWVDFNPSSATTTLPTVGGAFITKLNPSGGLIWAKALESGSTTSITGLDIDASGSVYASGTFYGAVDLDPGAGVQIHTSAGQSDGFVMKLTSSGGLDWKVTFGGTGLDVPLGISVDPFGDVHVAGWYFDTIDLDPDPLGTWLLTSGPQAQGFLWRLRQS